jgi:RNA-directed DNA polymerase
MAMIGDETQGVSVNEVRRWLGNLTCKSAAEARAALGAATRVLEQLGVRLNPQKTRIVHVRQGFDFPGYRIVQLQKKRKLPTSMIRSKLHPKGLIAYPARKSIRRFRDRVRGLTRRCAPLNTEELIRELNPTLRGWGEYYKRAHVRTLFHKLDGWIVRRMWSHRFRRWRCTGWRQLPSMKLYGEFGLVNLISLIPSIGYRPQSRASSWKLYAGNRHVQFERRTEASAQARLLRPDKGLVRR